MINKKTKFKIIARLLLATSFLGLQLGYNVIEPIHVNASVLTKTINNIVYSYNTSTKLAQVVRSVSARGAVTIPSTITVSGVTYKVTTIADSAFTQNNITSLTISGGVINIGNEAFYGCKSLTSVTLNNGVQNLGNNVFLGCSNLTYVSLPNTLVGLGESDFSGCTSLTSFTLPSSCTYLPQGFLGYCTNLSTVYLGNQLTTIGDNAFIYTGLTSINIPSTVTGIGDFAFANCTRLSTVTIPSSVSYIQTYAFQGCTGLTSVYIKNLNTSMDDTVFDGDSVTTLGLENITYTLNNTTLTATVPAGTVGAKTSLKFNGGKTYTVIIPDIIAPTFNFSQTMNTNGSVTITATAVDNSGGSGVKYMQLPNGNYVNGSTTTYTVTANGTYEFTAYDNAGNGRSQTVTVNNIDSTAPTLNLNQVANSNGTVTITATGSDSGSGMKNIKLPDGSFVAGSSATYTVSVNGNYTFTAYDNIGNYTTKTITISTVDSTPPSLTLSKNITNPTNSNVVISATASDNGSGIKNIKLPDGSFVAGSSATYTVSANGTYTFIAYDNVGNSATQSITISNIDKTVPTLTLNPSITTATNGNVTITATGNDSGTSGMKNIKLPDGSFVAGSSANYTVSANGTYTFIGYDNAGNATTQSITISNIDKTPPVITIGAYNTNPTNQNITVTATTNEGTLNATSHTFIANGSFDFIAIDSAGNKTTKTITISNIDKTLPIITTAIDNYDKANHSLTMSATTNKGTLNATSHTFTSDGSFDFVATDSLGNTATKRETVTGLATGTPSVVTTDITGGGSTSTASPITFISSTTNPTNNNVSVTINYPSYEVTKQYKIGTNGTWTNYTGAIILSENDTIYAKATDSNGIINQNSFIVNNIDKIAPIITIGSYNTSPTNGDVTVTVSTNEGTLNSTVHVFTANGSYDFISTDNAGNKTTKTVTITNIDKTAPKLVLTPSITNATNGNITINANATDNESGIKQIKLPDGTYITGSTANYTVSTNGTYTFVVYDNAGNSNTQSITVNNIDKTAPTLTFTPNTTNPTNSDVIIGVVASDVGSGVKQIKLPDGTLVNGGTASYTATTNGTYSFTVYDNIGNSSIQSISINNIDKAVPTLSLSASTNNATNGNVTISATGNDSGSGIKNIKLPDGSLVNGMTTSYIATTNGTYTFIVYDNAGNSTSQSVTINNIDKTAPILNLVVNTTSATNGNVTITATGSDSGSGVKNIKLPDGTFINGGTTTYTVTTNGTYTFIVYDNSGNSTTQSITVNNIDKNVPTLSLTPSTTNPTNGNIIITVTGSDSGSGIKQIKLPDGSLVNGGTTTYTVTANGTYTFVIYDNAGNSTTKSITINNIDKTSPTLNLAQNTTAWINGNVTITATGSDSESGVKNIKMPDGTFITSSTATYSATTNGTYTFVVYDNAGNSNTQSITINNIDKTIPTLTLTPSTTNYTGGDIIITAIGGDTQSGVKQIKLPDGTLVNASSANYSASVNGTYTFIIYDNAGNSNTQSITVSNIDKTAPTLTLTQDIISMTNSNVVITAIGGDTQSGIKQIKLPDGTIVNSGTTSFTATTNGTYSFIVYDNVGNLNTQSITVSNIDKIAPTLSLTPSITTATNSNVTINAIGNDSGSGISQIKLPDGTYITGSTANYIVSTNGTYSFVVYDKAGNSSTQSITVGNIDKIAPTLNLIPSTTIATNGSIVITATGSDNLSGIKNIKLPDGTYVSSSNVNYTVSTNGTYTFIIYDNAGNSSTQSITVSNIDKTAPTLNLSPNSTSWTNGNIVITATGEDSESGVSSITMPDRTTISGSIANYTVTTNGTYTFVVYDKAGNSSKKSITINNIDKTAPIISFIPDSFTPSNQGWTKDAETINVSASDSDSGISKIQLPDGSWINGGSTSYVVNNNGTYTFSAEDNQGNQTSKTITVSNIDKTAPTASVSQSTSGWTKSNVTLTIIGMDTESGIKSITIPNGTVINGSTANYTVSANGNYEFVITDNVGNTFTKSVTVTNIDKTLPILKLTLDSDLITNKTVTINAIGSDNESGIKSITKPDGTIVNGSTTNYIVDKNGTYTFSTTDVAGNIVSTSITINNIIAINTVSGIDHIEYKLDGATVQDWTTYSSLAILNEGITTIYARAVDKAGNYSDVAISVVKLDRSSPINGSIKIVAY